METPISSSIGPKVKIQKAKIGIFDSDKFKTSYHKKTSYKI